MVEKLRNPGFVSQPKSPTTCHTKSHMLSLDLLFNSMAGSAGDTPHKKSHRVNRTQDAIDVAKLKGNGVMGGSRSGEGESKIGASKVGGTVGDGSPGGGVTEVGVM